MGYDNKISQFMCYACIGDVYLKGEICCEGELCVCMICGKRKRAISFYDLCDRIHYIITSEFARTDSELSSWALCKELEVNWVREGENLYDILDQKPALRVNLDYLEVRHIRAVEYKPNTGSVYMDLERSD